MFTNQNSPAIQVLLGFIVPLNYTKATLTVQFYISDIPPFLSTTSRGKSTVLCWTRIDFKALCDDSLRHMQWGTGTDSCHHARRSLGVRMSSTASIQARRIPQPFFIHFWKTRSCWGRQQRYLHWLGIQERQRGLDLLEQTSMPPKWMGGERGVVEGSSSMPCNAAQSIFPVFTCNNSACPSRICLHWQRLTRTASVPPERSKQWLQKQHRLQLDSIQSASSLRRRWKASCARRHELLRALKPKAQSQGTTNSSPDCTC